MLWSVRGHPIFQDFCKGFECCGLLEAIQYTFKTSVRVLSVVVFRGHPIHFQGKGFECCGVRGHPIHFQDFCKGNECCGLGYPIHFQDLGMSAVSLLEGYPIHFQDFMYRFWVLWSVRPSNSLSRLLKGFWVLRSVRGYPIPEAIQFTFKTSVRVLTVRGYPIHFQDITGFWKRGLRFWSTCCCGLLATGCEIQFTLTVDTCNQVIVLRSVRIQYTKWLLPVKAIQYTFNNFCKGLWVLC